MAATSSIIDLHPVERKRGPFAEIKRGSIVVKIYSRPNGRGPFDIIWHELSGGGRKHTRRAQWPKAKSLAEEKALALANGYASLESFTHEDRASYQRALELLAPTGHSLELAAAEYSAAIAQLKGHSLSDVVRFFLRAHSDSDNKTIPQIVELFIAEKSADPDLSDRWRKTLSGQLERFAAHFQCPLSELRAHQINTWLCALPVGKYTRRHYRAAVCALVKFAKQRNFLSTSWDEIDRIPSIRARAVEEIRILTPEQITSLLAIAPASIVPFIVMTAFAGVRNEEMTGADPVLDWRDVRINQRIIYVPKEVGKTGKTSHSRVVPISDNLAAWLLPHAKPNGRVCNLANVSNALCRLKKRVGIPSGKNETRNTLRKSFISYRLALVNNIPQVAKEAGTSVAKIQTNYGRPIPDTEAKRWFGIYPTSSGVIQLNFALP